MKYGLLSIDLEAQSYFVAVVGAEIMRFPLMTSRVLVSTAGGGLTVGPAPPQFHAHKVQSNGRMGPIDPFRVQWTTRVEIRVANIDCCCYDSSAIIS